MKGFNIEFAIKVKPDYLRVVWFGIWMILSLIMVAHIIDFILNTRYHHFDMIFPLVVILLIDIFLLRYILWQLRGAEIIQMNEKELAILRKGSFFMITRKYETEYISDFRFEHTNAPIILRLYRKKEGKIKFTYMDMTRNFGQTINSSEAVHIIDDLNKGLNN